MSRIVFIFFGLVLSLFGSCSKDNTDEKLKEEEDKLAAYMADHPEADKIDGGVIYLIKTKKQEDGAKVDAGNYILWNYTIKNFETGQTEYTSDKTSGIIYKESYVDGGPELTLVQSSAVDEGIKLLKKGESGDIYIPSRYTSTDFQTRIWKVDIVEVIGNLTVYQEALMYNYLRGNASPEKRSFKIDSVKNVKSTENNKEYNVMYHIVDRGAGDPIPSDATKIETRTSAAYTIQEGVVRPFAFEQDFTWERTSTKTNTDCVGEILRKMNKGGKAVIVMPHILYYGDEPFWDDNNSKMQIVVPKWSVLIFTITIKS